MPSHHINGTQSGFLFRQRVALRARTSSLPRRRLTAIDRKDTPQVINIKNHHAVEWYPNIYDYRNYKLSVFIVNLQ